MIGWHIAGILLQARMMKQSKTYISATKRTMFLSQREQYFCLKENNISASKRTIFLPQGEQYFCLKKNNVSASKRTTLANCTFLMILRFSGRVSVEKECIICMDAERACLLSPCHHLATCQVVTIVMTISHQMSPLSGCQVVRLSPLSRQFLIKCHHLIFQDCGDMLVQRADCCPVCRTDITDVVHFFRC